MQRLIVVAVAGIGLAACTAAQVQTASKDLLAACADIEPLLSIAALIPEANTIAAGVSIGCKTAAGLARLADDPTSAEWLGIQAQMLKGLLAKAPINRPAGSARPRTP